MATPSQYLFISYITSWHYIRLNLDYAWTLNLKYLKICCWINCWKFCLTIFNWWIQLLCQWRITNVSTDDHCNIMFINIYICFYFLYHIMQNKQCLNGNSLIIWIILSCLTELRKMYLSYDHWSLYISDMDTSAFFQTKLFKIWKNNFTLANHYVNTTKKNI